MDIRLSKKRQPPNPQAEQELARFLACRCRWVSRRARTAARVGYFWHYDRLAAVGSRRITE
jgi:hypothetical protein